jgi:hypothetical protein
MLDRVAIRAGAELQLQRLADGRILHVGGVTPVSLVDKAKVTHSRLPCFQAVPNASP